MLYQCLIILFCIGFNVVSYVEKDLYMSLDAVAWEMGGSSGAFRYVKFYTRLVIIYIAIFCIFASKFAEKALFIEKNN